MACGILVPPSGFQLMPPTQLETELGNLRVLATGPPGKSQENFFKGNTTKTDLVFKSSVLPLSALRRRKSND